MKLALSAALIGEVHLVPSQADYRKGPLYAEMLAAGVFVHQPHEFSAIERGAPVFGFCNAEFLDRLDEIREYSTNTVFVNCMTCLFEKERRRMAEGKIRTFLYQNNNVRLINAPILQGLNPNAKCNFLIVRPYFDRSRFPFVEKRSEEFFGCGRISRQDADKYARNTLHIYEYFVAPKLKRGLFLGFDKRSEEKIGKPYDWYPDSRGPEGVHPAGVLQALRDRAPTDGYYRELFASSRPAAHLAASSASFLKYGLKSRWLGRPPKKSRIR